MFFHNSSMNLPGSCGPRRFMEWLTLGETPPGGEFGLKCAGLRPDSPPGCHSEVMNRLNPGQIEIL